MDKSSSSVSSTRTAISLPPKDQSTRTAVSSAPKEASTRTAVSSAPKNLSTRTAVSSTPKEASTRTAVSSMPKTASTRTAISSTPKNLSTRTAVSSKDQSTRTARLKVSETSARAARSTSNTNTARLLVSETSARTAKSISNVSDNNRTAMSPFQHSRKPGKKDLPRKPWPKLPTMDELKKAIPPHIFKIDDSMGYYHFARDYAMAIIGFVVLRPILEGLGGWLGLFVWYYIMGIIGCAVFCLGHDAIHTSLTNNWLVNDILGHLLFAPQLIPYYPWRISHMHHHAHTNNIDRDTVHPFYTEEQWFDLPEWYRTVVQSPLQQFFMFMPVYLLFGWADGSHYYPFGSMYATMKDRLQCVISASACLASAYIAYMICGYDVFVWLKYYIVPVLFSGMFINLMTLLNHVDPELTEGYAEEEWGYMRGQLQTIDREWGFGIDQLWHTVTEGHFMHHLFLRVPNYHLKEGTEYLRKALKPLDGTQYAYKRVVTRDWPLRMFLMPYQADYLVEKYKNIFYYHRRVEREALEEQASGTLINAKE